MKRTQHVKKTGDSVLAVSSTHTVVLLVYRRRRQPRSLRGPGRKKTLTIPSAFHHRALLWLGVVHK